MIDLFAMQEARLQLHYAVQPLATATQLLPAQPESAQTALFWNASDRTIQTTAIAGKVPATVLFDPQVFSLIVASEEDMFQFDLKHQSLSAALDWLRTVLWELGLDARHIKPLAYPTYDFPFHPIALGDVFHGIAEPVQQTTIDLFDRSHTALLEITHRYRHNSAVRLWPHHFDIATLLHYDGDKSIGVGFCLGDRSYDRPYWYVSPYPYPETLGKLPMGEWHTAGWTGAVWTLTDLAQIDAQAITDFLVGAISAAAKSMGVEP